MWPNHHARRSAGGRTSFTMSSPARVVPSAPKTTGTMPSRSQLGPGLTWPLARDGAIAAERHVEAEDGQQRQEDLRAPERQGDGRHRDDRHRPEIDLAPEPMRAAALHGEHRQRRENEGDRAGRDVDPAQRRDQSFSRPFPGRTARPGARRRRRCAGAGDTAPSGRAPRDAPVWRSPCGARSHTRESSGPRRA